MATERLRRRVEQLLDEAEEAISQHNWEVVRGHAQSVLALDPANADGLALIEAAERAAANSSGPQPSSTPDAIESAEQPTSFSGGRYQVKSFLGEGGRTRFYGLFADPVEHLRTPGVLNELIDSRGLDAVVLPMHVTPEHLAEAVAGIRLIRNFPGFMVSIPHKSAVAELCDDLLPNARACGVVNAVRIDQDGRLIGETFDGLGMVKSIETQRVLSSDTRVLLVGAGGVGRAIAVAISLAGVGYLAIANRTLSKADELADTVRRAAPNCVVKSDSSFDPKGFDIVINATSLGLNGEGPMPIEVSRISTGALVAEVVMVPEITPMLDAAQEQGLDVVRGLEMLTKQIEILADFLNLAN